LIFFFFTNKGHQWYSCSRPQGTNDWLRWTRTGSHRSNAKQTRIHRRATTSWRGNYRFTSWFEQRSLTSWSKLR